MQTELFYSRSFKLNSFNWQNWNWHLLWSSHRECIVLSSIINVSTKQDNGHFGNLLTVDQFEILQGAMEEEEAQWVVRWRAAKQILVPSLVLSGSLSAMGLSPRYFQINTTSSAIISLVNSPYLLRDERNMTPATLRCCRELTLSV